MRKGTHRQCRGEINIFLFLPAPNPDMFLHRPTSTDAPERSPTKKNTHTHTHTHTRYTGFYNKMSPKNLKKMLRKYPASNTWAAIFKYADLS